nr:tify [Pinus koraiensis]
MSPSESEAFEFLRVQNACKEEKGVNGSTSLKYGTGKQLAKPRFVQGLSRIKPEMMQKVLSSIGLSDHKKTDFATVKGQAEDFNFLSEASSHTEILELFPVKPDSSLDSSPKVIENKITLPFAIGQNDPDSRFVPAKAPGQQSTTQLTIFYNGAMNVYDVSAEEAQGIMNLASANSSRNTTSTISSSKIDQTSKPLPANPGSSPVNENKPQTPPIGLEIARKLSLQCFLRKRKERFNRVAPYTTMKSATLPSEAEKESEDQIILSLA